jgi:hypothetical protein
VELECIAPEGFIAEGVEAEDLPSFFHRLDSMALIACAMR